MLTQGDSLYDIIDKRDHASVQTQLLQTTYSPCPDTGLDSRAFFCRMNVSRSFRRQAGFGDHKVCGTKIFFRKMKGKKALKLNCRGDVTFGNTHAHTRSHRLEC